MGKILDWLQERIKHWIKPAYSVLIIGILSDQTRSHTELVVENAHYTGTSLKPEEPMFKKNTRHMQIPLTSNGDELPEKLRKRLEHSWAGVFYKEVYSKIDESPFAAMYADCGNISFYRALDAQTIAYYFGMDIGHNLSQKRLDIVACNRACLGHGPYQETT